MVERARSEISADWQAEIRPQLYFAGVDAGEEENERIDSLPEHPNHPNNFSKLI